MRRTFLDPAVVMLLLGATHAAVAEPITTTSLVTEMIDMHRLATFPDPAFDTVQFSSYDHTSTLPGGPNWFANSDGFGNEPVPNFEKVLEEPDADGVGEYLMCDVEGPGTIVRTWTAAINGRIRVDLDGADEPVYDGPAQEFLLQPYRRFAADAGIDNTMLEGTFYQRNAAYCPMPFAKRCRIVWRGKAKEIHFYQIQVRRYAPGAEVVTFSIDELRAGAGEIERVAGVLLDPEGQWSDDQRSAAEVAIGVEVPAGAIAEAALIEGAKAVERLALKVTAADRDLALRQTILHIVCDAFPWGHVQAPIGDFFGAAPGVNPFNAVPFTVRPDGSMICRFVQPFARSMRILLENKGEQAVTVEGTARVVDHVWNEFRSMHFRARWRVDHGLVASNEAVQDLPYLMARGRGVFVGAAAFILNPNPIPTPYGSWWGEGDEKIFVDDDDRPSTFGTGSEDYYNYAWSSPDIWLMPYCGQPRNDGPANRGFVTNHRWHILDPLPFASGFAFYMELYSHERTPGVSYARIAYHYAKPGLIDDHIAITGEDVRPLELPADWQPVSRMGAVSSRFYQAEELLTGTASISHVEDRLWSGGRLLVWLPEKVGDELTLKVPVVEDGRRVFKLIMRRDGAAGRVSVRLDGEPAGFGGEGGVVDLHMPHRTISRVIAGKDLKVTAGEHELTLRYEGGPAGVEQPEIGLDVVWVQRP